MIKIALSSSKSSISKSRCNKSCMSNSLHDRCLGAADGTVSRVHFTEAPCNLESFRYRKGFFAQNILLCFFYDKSITFYSVMAEGCSHDSTVISQSGFLDVIPGLQCKHNDITS